MAKKLKFWNVRGWGRKDYDKDSPTYDQYVYPGAVWHIFVCAHSRAHASRIMAEHLPLYSGFKDNPGSADNELKVYSSECWGTDMKHIEPEVGIWVGVGREFNGEIKCIWKESNDETS